MPESPSRGPLGGLRVVEFAAIGPAPFCGMLLADLGAQVLLVDRAEPADVGISRERRHEIVHRGKSSMVLDLKSPSARSTALALAGRADVLIEGFRPGAMERLGLGPAECHAVNPGLVYGRVTGFGQTGPLAQRAGHDLNYISLSGVLHAIGRSGHAPTPPINLVGDYAGGSMLLAIGILAALASCRRTGVGQVVDAAMVEGSALLMAPYFGMLAGGLVGPERGTNLLDGGAPFYDVYLCADGAYVAFGAIEKKFRAIFAQRTGFDAQLLLADDRAAWPRMREELARLFRTKTQAGWCDLLKDCDACVTPVLAPGEAAAHEQNMARGTFYETAGVLQPSPAPRFSNEARVVPAAPPEPGEGGDELALAWGVAPELLKRL